MNNEKPRTPREWLAYLWWWVCLIPILRGPRRRCWDCGEKREGYYGRYRETRDAHDIKFGRLPRDETCPNCGAVPALLQR